MRNQSSYRRGITVLAGIALLSILPATTTPAFAFGEFGISTESKFVRCVATDIRASFGIPVSTYAVKGVCGVFDDSNTGSGSTFENEKHLGDYPWTAEGKYNSSTRATSERLTISDMKSRSMPFFDSTMQCPQDPWMTALSQPCLDIRDSAARVPLDGYIQDVLTTLWRLKPTAPYSSLIRTDQRATLDAQYRAWRAGLPKSKVPGPVVQLPSPPVPPGAAKVNPLTTAPVPTADMFTITNPVWNASVQQGQLFLKVTPPKIGMTQISELKFEWLDAPPDWCGKPPCPPYVNQFPIDTSPLLQGYQVEPHVIRGHTGRWEVSVRASGKAVPGPWSFPVRFQLFVTQPTQSRKETSPVQQTAPLPSSSVVQPSPVPQTAPLSPPSVMQTPPPSSSAPAQMNRSSSMFTTRGVEEKGGKKGSETVDTSPGLEKKP